MDDLRKRANQLQADYHLRGRFDLQEWHGLVAAFIAAGRYSAAAAFERRLERTRQVVQLTQKEPTP